MLTQRGVILAKYEAEHGEDLTPAPTTDAVQIFDFGISVLGEKLERDPYRQTLSRIKPLLGKKYVEITFTTELTGSGVTKTKPRTDPLFRACAMASSAYGGNTYFNLTPLSTVLESCTIYAYVDGILHKVTYCQGSFEFVFEAGQLPKVNWTFRGFYVLPTDVEVPTTCVYDAAIPMPVMASGILTIGSYAGIMRSMNINMNNTLAEISDINAASGIAGFEVTQRAVTGTIILNAVLRGESNGDFWSYWDAVTSKIVTLVLDNSTGNDITIAMPVVTFDAVNYSDADGIRTMELPFSAALSAAAGDDEIDIKIDD